MNKQEIVEILMQSESITESEAWAIVNRCQDEIDEVLVNSGGAFSTYDAATDVLACYLGLEPDYLIAFI